MAMDLKVSVKKHIDGLNTELAAVNRRGAALRGEIEKCEQFYRALDGAAGTDGQKKPGRVGRPPGSRTVKKPPAVKKPRAVQKPSAVRKPRAVRKQPVVQKPKGRPGRRGSMIDWNSILRSLPAEFSLDNLESHKIASEKPRAYLRQVVVRWSKEGKIKRTARGKYQKG